jgi:hypothetical protein
MIDFETLSPDAPAIIMLCTSLGEPRGGAGDRPLGPVAFARLAEALTRSSLQSPRDLPGMSADEIAGSLDVDPDLAASYARRVARGGQLTFELDRLRSRGIWVLTIADEAYPTKLRDRLGTSAPPVLFGTGPAGLLGNGGVAIVGSRDADQAAVAFTERLGEGRKRHGAQWSVPCPAPRVTQAGAQHDDGGGVRRERFEVDHRGPRLVIPGARDGQGERVDLAASMRSKQPSGDRQRPT